MDGLVVFLCGVIKKMFGELGGVCVVVMVIVVVV